ncbi:MAG: hypothetical protein ACHREM_23020 [Polyangiales bacterium]
MRSARRRLDPRRSRGLVVAVVEHLVGTALDEDFDTGCERADRHDVVVPDVGACDAAFTVIERDVRLRDHSRRRRVDERWNGAREGVAEDHQGSMGERTGRTGFRRSSVKNRANQIRKDRLIEVDFDQAGGSSKGV